MTDEQKRDFTRRLSNCNRGQMIVIVYDIFFAAVYGARESLMSGDDAGFKTEARRAENVLTELQDTLDFKYEISRSLFPVYDYCKRLIAMAVVKHREDELSEAERHMAKLYEAFKTAASADTSEPIMEHSEAVTAGLTYGRGYLNEASQEEPSRGFWA